MLRVITAIVTAVFGCLAFWHVEQVASVLSVLGFSEFALQTAAPAIDLVVKDGALSAAFAAAFGALGLLTQIRDRLSRKTPVAPERMYAEPTFTRESGA
jgi:hypothetical protein